MRYLLSTIATLFIMYMLTSCDTQSEQIEITDEMVINESGTGVAFHWFDEQGVEDTLPVTGWDTRGEVAFWPASMCVDLKGKYYISSIKIFDGEKSLSNGTEFEKSGGKLSIASGIPFDWKSIKSYSLQNSNGWHTIDMNIETSFLQFTKESTVSLPNGESDSLKCDVNITEIIIYGKKIGGIKDNTENRIVTKRELPEYTVDQFMGTNAYKWSDNEMLKQVVGIVREYSHWSQNGVLNTEDSIEWVEVPEIGSFDKYYSEGVEKYELEIIPDVHLHANKELIKNKPNFGGKTDDPFSYKIIADYMFQMAARYGNVKVDDSLLRVKSGSPVFSGAGLVNYYETWNEPERWWGPPEDHFSPYEYAAMASAAYDGHQGSMGMGFGIKQADSTAVHLMAGISNLEFDFPRAVQLWSDYYRNGVMPFDVLNFHHYNNSAGLQHAKAGTYGISPEADNFKERLKKAVSERDKYFPGMELWVTEFGWDTDDRSIQSSTGHELYPDNISIFELQGIWMVRAYLAGLAAKVDRLFMFMADDIEDPGLFHNSGFVTLDGTKKPSWYYTATMFSSLKGTRFVNEVDTGIDNVLCYEFTDNEKTVYVIWCPTSDGTEVSDFELNINNDDAEVEITRLSDKDQMGITEEVQLKSRQLLIKITEKPVFVTVR